ncbi:MAG TPA: endonuclease MutS2 [Chloroflexota bacterium]|nr:endonuclease MutS2 [Chloroflexota bacterium]
MIAEKTLQTLEFDKILALLADEASFSVGKERALALRPATDVSAARAGIAYTAEARTLLAARPATHLGGAHDVRPAVRRAEVGSVLTPFELLEVAATLGASARFRHAVGADLEIPWLRAQAQRMAEHRDLQKSLEDTFSERGEILDSASPELRRLRNELRTYEGRLMDRLNSMVSSSDYRSSLQEPIVTMRNGRFVIPVRAESRSKIPGVVHDQSASGQTIFVEPLAVTEMNNKLKEIELAEQREIERILRALSARVAEHGPELRETVEALGAVDLAFAKARYAERLKAVAPALNDDGMTNLVLARHPLLRGDVVPISMWLGEDFRVLVITGPNTGGKTVALKTFGLLTLMAQAGMHVPAAAESTIAVYPRIWADIGDEQSIEQSLSTFSSHMRNITGMLPQIDAKSLVLLDELGAGTDPQEGAALARTILQALLASGARAVVTTHYSELKTFAHEAEGVENASVEFDVETLSPTYRLTIGLPGRSQALAIAQRLGLPGSILEQARGFVSSGAVRVEQLLAQIQAERQEIAELHTRTIALHEDARKLRERVRSQFGELRKERERVLAEAREEAAATVRELRGRLRALEEEARGMASRREQRELRSRLDELQGEAAEALQPAGVAVDAAPRLQPIREGATVAILSLGQTGTVLSVGDGEAEVQLGQFKMRIPTDDLEVVAGKRREADAGTRVQTTSPAPPMEIDIRGWRADDALHEIDQYIHDNYMHGQGVVRIVHGKGTGALRRAIREQLSSNPLVKSFESEETKLGGEGVTVVKLAL